LMQSVVRAGAGNTLLREARAIETIDLEVTSLRELNQMLHRLDASASDTQFRILNPRGRHAVAAGVDAPTTIEIDGNVGYYCAGMNKQATVVIDGSAGVGVAENMMSGFVHVKGDASQSAGATGCGGMLVIDGNASARCGISNRGIDIVVKGSVGHMSAFMAQAGTLVALEGAGEALGDSIYEAKLYIRGPVKSLGADCIEKPMRDAHKAQLKALLDKAGASVDIAEFKRYGSARKLYHFHIDNAGAY
jgi:methylamine---glutamate N-methyltransferase subunit B